MVKRDVIFSAFASSPAAQTRGAGVPSSWVVQPLDLFVEPPLLVEIPKTGAPGQAPEAWGTAGFARTVEELRRVGGGSILRGALRRFAPDMEPRRICVTGFSAGNAFVRSVLASPVDAKLVDTVVSLDGATHSLVNGTDYLPSLEPWLQFASRAAGLDRMRAQERNPFLGPLFVHAHTKIELTDPNTGKISTAASSTHRTADLLFQTLTPEYLRELAKLPEAVVAEETRVQNAAIARLRRALSDFPSPTTIRCGGTEVAFGHDLPRGKGGTWPWVGQLGNFFDLNFEGTTGPYHCFVAFVAQPAIWRAFLAPRWNARTAMGEVDFQLPSPAEPGGGIVRAGALTEPSAPWLFWASLGAAVGATAGLVMTREDTRRKHE